MGSDAGIGAHLFEGVGIEIDLFQSAIDAGNEVEKISLVGKNIQFWPVLYYEGEQNRYFHDVVGDMNLMKVIKTLEGWGVDLKKIVQNGGLSRKALPERYTWFDLVPNISDYLSKVDLTTDDLEEMVADAGITIGDLLVTSAYLLSSDESPETNIAERTAAPLYLLRSYEQTLADWFKLAGYNVDYELWGM